jgi:hypothetical protein
MNESYQIWHPWDATSVDVNRVAWDHGRLDIDIVLFPRREARRVSFRVPIAVRFADEGNRFVTSRDAAWPTGIGVLVVENSSFLQWLRNENGGIYDGDPIRHFAILTESNLWVDVISILDPEVAELAVK